MRSPSSGNSSARRGPMADAAWLMFLVSLGLALLAFWSTRRDRR
jgi:hypothetical protein